MVAMTKMKMNSRMIHKFRLFTLRWARVDLVILYLTFIRSVWKKTFQIRQHWHAIFWRATSKRQCNAIIWNNTTVKLWNGKHISNLNHFFSSLAPTFGGQDIDPAVAIPAASSRIAKRRASDIEAGLGLGRSQVSTQLFCDRNLPWV